MTNTILQITKIDPDLLGEIKKSFNDLPETSHADGGYRLRKYSKVEAIWESHWLPSLDDLQITPLDISEFSQSEKYNKHQGGKARKFTNIEPSVLFSSVMKEMIGIFLAPLDKSVKYQFDIHQIRVNCKGGATQLSPEGWHQDGYDRVAMIGVDRNNIIGGEALLSTYKTQAPFLQATLDAGTMLIIDDNYLWHNGRSIQAVDEAFSAWMDLLVFTLKK